MAPGALRAHEGSTGLRTPLRAGGVRNAHRAVIDVVEGDAHKPAIRGVWVQIRASHSRGQESVNDLGTGEVVTAYVFDSDWLEHNILTTPVVVPRSSCWPPPRVETRRSPPQNLAFAREHSRGRS